MERYYYILIIVKEDVCTEKLVLTFQLQCKEVHDVVDLIHMFLIHIYEHFDSEY